MHGNFGPGFVRKLQMLMSPQAAQMPLYLLSTIYYLLSTIYDMRSAICDLRSTIYDLRSMIHESRLVTLPQWQGFAIGPRLSEGIGQILPTGRGATAIRLF